MTRALRIVLAEDEPDTREFLQEALSRLGHQVVSAATGPQLVELARASEPDLIVADIWLPGMDAIQASTVINRHREVPVVLLTGHHDAETLGRAVVDHVMAYLVKPVDAADIEAAIAVAFVRFGHYLHLRQEADDLKQALEDRKVIERAKGALMRRLEVDEDEAFRRLRKLASDQNKKVIAVARAVLASEEVFQQLGGR
jgi:response regulator NasT